MNIRSVLPALEAAFLLSGWVATHTASAQAPKVAADALVGTWTGPISAAGNTLTFVVQLKVDDKGGLQGSLTVPEQGGVSLPMSEVHFADNKFNFKIPAPIVGEFTSTYANGAFTGLWRPGDPPMPPEGVPVVLKKGTYVAPVHVLQLDADSFGKLAGTWKGDMQAPGPQGDVNLAVAFRFETNPHGDRVGFMDLDVPGQNLRGVAITEVSLAAGKLVIKIPSMGGEYDANFSSTSMGGQMTLGPGSFALTMTKK
jgi:hypothetical protein